jgi:S1-C subfamily serine protease
VNSSGEVIGVNVAYVPPERGAVALGFAIPAPTVIDVVRQLLETGRVQQAYLGISNPVRVTPELAQSFGLEVDEGVTFVSVLEDTPAARAGLEPGDVIVAMDDEPVETVEDLFAQLRRKRPGQDVAVEFFRGGDRREVSVQLAARPEG